MENRLFSYVVIGTCFLLGLMDYVLSFYLLNTGFFMEINRFAYPYFFLIPLFYLLKNDKLIIDALIFFTIFLGVVVFFNVVNLTGYMVMIS